MSVTDQLFAPTHFKRFAFFFLAYIIMVIASLYAAFLFRLDFRWTSYYEQLFVLALPSFLVVKLMSFAFFRLYRISWRFVSINDVSNIVKAVLFSSGALAVAIFFFRSTLFPGFPRSVLLIDAVLTLLLVFGLRISKRTVLEVMRKQPYNAEGKRAEIVGAGNTGEMILRDMQRSNFVKYAPVAFVDDDPNRIGTYVHGVKVSGALSALSHAIKTFEAEAVILAIPSLSHMRLKEIYRQAHSAGATEIKIVPRIYDFQRPQVRVQELEDLQIEDLIGRQAVTVDYKQIGNAMENAVVLVTGAAGSLGSENGHQLCRVHPRELVLFEIDETELFHLEHRLARAYPELINRVRCFVGDVRDRERVEQAFSLYKPSVVFHAAAYKHVPMMEANVDEALKTNVLGTHVVAQAAVAAGVSRFVLISTDKAVNPTSVMGATKRMAEKICLSFHLDGGTAFVSVRFGNVLGSRGSVLPLFLEQIQKGEALTVTHQEMKRYFMTIPEAVSLVLQAGVLGQGGDVMVLDMGDPVRIIDLAEELIRLHGLTPYEDIDIKIIGPRPGEKMFEEYLHSEEGTTDK